MSKVEVMVARGVHIVRETYLAILLDRESNGPVSFPLPLFLFVNRRDIVVVCKLVI